MGRRIEKGKNYGWPVQAYGEEYSGSPISGAATVREGMEQPVYYWDPVIAPSGAQFYTGNAFPAWKGNLFIGGMKDRKLVRLVLDHNRVTGEEHLLEDRAAPLSAFFVATVWVHCTGMMMRWIRC